MNNACAFPSADYTARVRKLAGIILFGMAIAVGVSLADTPVTAVPGDVAISNCLVRLEQAVEQVATLERFASNQTVRATCLGEKRRKLRGLVELTRARQESWAAHKADHEEELATEDEELVATMCERAEKILVEAAQCRDAAPVSSRKRTSTPPPAKRPATTVTRAVPAAVRDDTTCLKQDRLAELMVLAMGRESATPLKDLTKESIEPLNGWSAEACVTVDDFCVVVARVMKLKPADGEDPYEYVLAVRQAGLPVDSVLPRRPRGVNPPVLVEAEVRRFLMYGFAAQPASARPVAPN